MRQAAEIFASACESILPFVWLRCSLEQVHRGVGVDPCRCREVLRSEGGAGLSSGCTLRSCTSGASGAGQACGLGVCFDGIFSRRTRTTGYTAEWQIGPRTAFSVTKTSCLDGNSGRCIRTRLGEPRRTSRRAGTARCVRRCWPTMTRFPRLHGRRGGPTFYPTTCGGRTRIDHICVPRTLFRSAFSDVGVPEEVADRRQLIRSRYGADHRPLLVTVSVAM